MDDRCMAREHQYRITTVWTGNLGEGTRTYRAYGRNFEIRGEGKEATITGSSDPHFRGEAARYNPEELLLAALSACHMLSYLHVCADRGIIVTDYRDDAEGQMTENRDGSGEFRLAVLKPRVTITDPARIKEAEELHDKAHSLCFVARSVNFPVEHQAVVSGSPVE